jgi:leucyl aminopeptidase (aminopeptidase T)
MQRKHGAVAQQEITFNMELLPGAHNAINTCLRLKQNERITIITDHECLEIAAALVHEINNVGSTFSLFVLEDFAQRPLEDMPQRILDELAKSHVSIFACVAQTGELGSRIQMTNVVNKHKIRHAHMVNITKKIMCEGMRADFHAVDAISTILVEKARKAKTIRAISKGGTNVIAEFSPSLKWLKTSGIISTEKWGNLPGGEILTTPANVNGLFVVDGVVGDYLCPRFGDLQDTPLYIEIEHSTIQHLHCSNNELLDEFSAYISTDENSNRAGEFAIGTNIAVKEISGQILQDEKIPGVHIAFGNPYGEHTGANWVSTTHIDCVGRNFDIWMDEEHIMANGVFLV